MILDIGVILFDDVGHQPQIVDNQGIAGLLIPLLYFLQAFPFLLGGQGFGERTSRRDVERHVQKVAQSHGNKDRNHSDHLPAWYAARGLFGAWPGKNSGFPVVYRGNCPMLLCFLQGYTIIIGKSGLLSRWISPAGTDQTQREKTTRELAASMEGA